jgi:hypothetical protein
MMRQISNEDMGSAMRAILAAIVACPDRGEVLPHTQQPECGCAELTRCRAGKGATPGSVTTTDCVVCQLGTLQVGGMVDH